MLKSDEKGFFYRNRYPLGILLAAVFIIYLLVATKAPTPTSPVEEKSWLVTSDTITLTSEHPNIRILGTVESPNESALSAALSAEVASVVVREGERVAAGALLVQLDDRDLVLQRQQLEADVQDIEAQIEAESNRFASDQRALEEEQKLLSIAEQALSRQARLKASNLVAQERYEQAESERARAALAVSNRQANLADHPSRLQQLKARLQRAESALNKVRLDLDRTRITAPFDAWITRVDVSPGERIQPGQQLVWVYEPASLEIRAQIPNRHAARIREAITTGEQIGATANWHGRTIPLGLDRLSAKIQAQSGGLDALFRPSDALQLPGLGASLNLYVNLPAYDKVASLPVSALYGENRIYRITDDRLESITVTVMGQQFTQSNTRSDRVLVRSASLHNGDQIVTTQLPNAIDGLKVTQREAL